MCYLFSMQEDFGIYIHVPWCRRRCPYCNFYLEVGKPDLRYKNKIIEEFYYQKERLGPWPKAKSLYFGGGTPSSLGADNLKEIISFFKHEGYLTKDCEITIEANPEDITKEYVDKITPLVNRLSLGVQSLQDDILRFLGRKHRREDVLRVLEIIKNHSSLRLSIDLIIGMPKEDLKSLKQDINFLYQNNINHISAYLLTIEEGTRFSKTIKKIDDDAQAQSFLFVQDLLTDLGYEQYDISSYARDKSFSIHNQIYWALGEFLGLGPGAHSMKLLKDGQVLRFANGAKIEEWLSYPIKDAYFSYDRLDPKHALRESLAFGLRNMVKGIDHESLSMRHKTAIPEGFFSLVSDFIFQGLIFKKEERYILSKKGALMADCIMREILGLL